MKRAYRSIRAWRGNSLACWINSINKAQITLVTYSVAKKMKWDIRIVCLELIINLMVALTSKNAQVRNTLRIKHRFRRLRQSKKNSHHLLELWVASFLTQGIYQDLKGTKAEGLNLTSSHRKIPLEASKMTRASFVLLHQSTTRVIIITAIINNSNTLAAILGISMLLLTLTPITIHT